MAHLPGQRIAYEGATLLGRCSKKYADHLSVLEQEDESIID
jgi:hypothetical protein